MVAGLTCSDRIDNCLEEICLNGGSCIDLVHAFECQCAEGFAGDLCEENVNECMSNPCSNGGLCVDLVGSYRYEILLQALELLFSIESITRKTRKF